MLSHNYSSSFRLQGCSECNPSLNRYKIYKNSTVSSVEVDNNFENVELKNSETLKNKSL